MKMKEVNMRKVNKIRLLLIGGVSFAAMSAGMTFAQEAGKPTPSPTEVQEIAPVTETAAAGSERVSPEGGEPNSASRTLELDESGLIRQQEVIGKDILLLDRQIRRSEMIADLIAVMGIEGFRKAFPDLADLIEDSPLVLQAELDEQKLLAQIEEEKKRVAAAMAPEQDPEVDGLAINMPPVRNDGSAMFVPPQEASALQQAINGMPAEVAPAANPTPEPATVLAEPAEPVEVVEVAPPEPVQEDIPISLREIYGTKGNYTAVISHGGEKIRVTKGDTLPGDTSIEFIGEDYIKVMRRGENIRYEIRG